VGVVVARWLYDPVELHNCAAELAQLSKKVAVTLFHIAEEIPLAGQVALFSLLKMRYSRWISIPREGCAAHWRRR